jgi:hypothetical protein
MSRKACAAERGGTNRTRFFNRRCDTWKAIPISGFLFFESDQAEVIRIFHELMGEGDHAGHVCEVKTTHEPLDTRGDPDDSGFPGEPHDLA